MFLDYYAFFSDSHENFDDLLSSIHTLMKELTHIFPQYSTLHFTGLSREEALQHPLPEKFDEFIRAIQKDNQDDSKISEYSLWAMEKDGEGALKISVHHSTFGNSFFLIEFYDIPKNEIASTRDVFDSMIMLLDAYLPIKYILERCYESQVGSEINRSIYIGWSIYARADVLRPITGFPSYQIGQNILRIASVEDVFDEKNPEHMRKAKELDRMIVTNTLFMKQTGYTLPASLAKDILGTT